MVQLTDGRLVTTGTFTYYYYHYYYYYYYYYYLLLTTYYLLPTDNPRLMNYLHNLDIINDIHQVTTSHFGCGWSIPITHIHPPPKGPRKMT